MHRWYSNADICYAYLWDVPTSYSVQDPCWGSRFDVRKVFSRSKWFSRGWTLQELLAPQVVEFFAQDWSPIGLRSNLKVHIKNITGINIRALEGDDLSTFQVAEKMSWAASRDTTRVEDRAYCLLGIFGVHMSLLYGEGKRAFIRLQEEILKTSEDYTIFSWSAVPGGAGLVPPNGLPAQIGLLADDPGRFRTGFGSRRYSNVITTPRYLLRRPGDSPITSLLGLDSDDSPPSLTGRGLRICLPLSEMPDTSDMYFACLRCQLTEPKSYLCIVLKRTENFQVFEKILTKHEKIPTVSTSGLCHKFKLYTIYIEEERKKPLLDPRRDCGMTRHASDIHRAGLQLFHARKYTEAEKLFQRALSIRKRMLPQDDQETMCSLLALVEAYDRQGKHDEHEFVSAELEEAEARIGKRWTTLGENVFVPFEECKRGKERALLMQRISPRADTAITR
jgi:hypothetical protein